MIPSAVRTRFPCLRPIGSGATSLVYEATDGTAPPVAVKILRPEHRLRLDLCTRFLNEALPIRDLHHPGIPRTYACELPQGESPYLIMERLQGSLAGGLARGALPLSMTLRIAAELADTLALLHARGIIHRDVKPQNILFAGEGDTAPVKLVDFGLAKWLAPGSALPSPTAEEDSLGTPEYMAPEQAIAARDAGPATDVYSLGVVLYQMLSGTLPFRGELASQLRRQHILLSPPPLPEQGLPPGLLPLCYGMLAKDREARPNAAAVAAALAALTSPAAPGAASPAR